MVSALLDTMEPSAIRYVVNTVRSWDAILKGLVLGVIRGITAPNVIPSVRSIVIYRGVIGTPVHVLSVYQDTTGPNAVKNVMITVQTKAVTPLPAPA